MQQCCKVMVNNSLIQPAARARDDLDHAIAGYAAASNCGGSSCQANEARTQYAISRMDFRFSNRPFGVKRFQAIHHSSVDVAHGLVLLFGLGTKALPSWDSKTRWNNLSGGLAVSVTAGPSGSPISPHPSARERHHPAARWNSSVLLLD